MKQHLILLACMFSFVVSFGQTETEKTVVNTGEELNKTLVEEVTGPDAAKTMTVNTDNFNNIPGNITLCEACSTIKITVPLTSTILFYNNNTFNVAHSMSITSTPTRYIRNIKAELVYFEYLPDAENCMACNKNSATFGNILSGTIGSVAGTASGNHQLEVNYIPAKAPGSFPVSIKGSMPPLVNCCNGTLRICMRYVVTFDDCTVCSQMVCYEKKKTTGLIQVPIDQNPN